MALYYCRVQVSKHATETHLLVYRTLKCYAKNLFKESLKPLVEIRIEPKSTYDMHRSYLIRYLQNQSSTSITDFF